MPARAFCLLNVTRKVGSQVRTWCFNAREGILFIEREHTDSIERSQ